MSKARLVITAVIVEKRPVGEVAREYGVARSWVYKLLARYRAEGEAAFEPRSRRPASSPSAIGPDAAELIVRLRKELDGAGLDAGPHTIAWHLEAHHGLRVSPATVHRYLARAGLVTPQPRKRPRSSWTRFAAEQPNELWQSDFTHWPLAGGRDAEILAWIDDHSRYVLSLTAHAPVTGQDVVGRVPRRVRRARRPRRHPHRQRPGLHHPPPALRRRRRPRAGAGRPRGHPQERQAEPPPDPGQGRAVPPDPQALARPPAPRPRPARPPRSARPVRRRVQPPPPAPLPRPENPRRRLRRPPQGRPRPRRRPPRNPNRPRRVQRHHHPQPPRAPPPHRRRPPPRRNPRPGHQRRPGHPDRRRRHRRGPPRRHHRPHPRLPAHRGTTRPQKTQPPKCEAPCPLCLKTSHP